METIGRIFKAAREKQKYSIREIAEQTKIGSRYLSALEEDNYNSFPSQTHITGFIRSYAKYLELDPERMIDIYKRTLVQEAPAPIEELTAPNKPKSNFSLFAGIFAVIGAFLFAFILFTSLPASKPRAPFNPDIGETNTTPPLTGERFFALGSFIPISDDGKRLVFEEFTHDTVIVTYDGERHPLSVGRTYTLDLNRDGNADIRIAITAISNQRAYGNATILHRPQNNDPLQQDTSPVSAAGRTILRAQEQTDIRLIISANGIATVNTVRDNQEQGNYFLKKGDTITVLARDTMQLTASNPHNLLLNLNNINLEMDTRNPAAGFVFKWRHSPTDGLYHLEYEQLR